MSKKVYGFIIAALLIIIALLGFYIYTLKNDKSQNNESTNETATQSDTTNTSTNNIYSYSDIEGFYKFSEPNKDIDVQDRDDKDSFAYNYGIYLWKNGTFSYHFTMNATNHVLGNYTIVDDEIHLNYLFEGGNDAGIHSTTGEKVLKIIDKDTLEDADAYFAQNSSTASKDIKLKRDTSGSDKYGEYDVSKIIDSYEIENNANKNNVQ